VHASYATSLKDFQFGCVRTSEGEVIADGTVKKKCVLQHDSKLGAVAAQLHGCQVNSIHQDAAARRFVERSHQTDDGGLACSGWSDKSGYSSRLGIETHIEQDLLAGIVGKIHVLKGQFTVDALDVDGAAGIFVFRFFVENFACAFEAGDGFGELRADGDYLKHRRNQHGKKRRVHEEHTKGHGAGQNSVRADV